ncbi:Pirin C-terminal cupin domain-containing protein [Frankia sp. EI5c]|nr:pirin-like C-terminal cupin domain-containing protein [Frankia sp. EI5c]OAA23325.1 Pirin C-terminal cupin domain-containing protein [Frankia sp. EI5c]
MLGGRPLREPIAHYGPFLMNSREQIIQAVEDYNAGRMGRVPVLEHRGGAENSHGTGANSHGTGANSSHGTGTTAG